MRDKAFTLAEVLITLTIIGVIAAITIPNLMKKWEDAHTVSAVKEAFSLLDNAFKQAVRENGDIYEWFAGTEREHDGEVIIDKLKPYLKIRKSCVSWGYSGQNASCINPITPQTRATYYVDLKDLRGKDKKFFIGDYHSYIQLENGMLIAIKEQYTTEQSDGYVGQIYIDINGKKGPNKLGYDAFYIGLDKNGPTIKPNGRTGSTAAFCSVFCTGPQATSYDQGGSCAKYILLYGNVDYKYKDVSKIFNTGAWW